MELSGSAEMALNIFYWQVCSWNDFCKGKNINFMQSICMYVLKHLKCFTVKTKTTNIAG